MIENQAKCTCDYCGQVIVVDVTHDPYRGLAQGWYRLAQEEGQKPWTFCNAGCLREFAGQEADKVKI